MAREVTVVDTQQGKLWEDLQSGNLSFLFRLVNKDSRESQKHVPQEGAFRTEVWEPQLTHGGGLNEKCPPLGP